MDLELQPIATLTPPGHSLSQPHPLDVGVLLIADATHHPVVVHGIDNGWLVLGALVG